MFSTQRPPDDWPNAIDHLVIGLVANKYKKLGKTSENLLLSRGVVLYKNPTVVSQLFYCLIWMDRKVS